MKVRYVHVRIVCDTYADSVSQSPVNLYSELLRSSDDGTKPYFENKLRDLYQRREALNDGAGPSGTYNLHTTPYGAQLTTPATAETSLARKRSLGPAEYSEAKRHSAQPSPVTPGTPSTPSSIFEAPGTGPSQQWTLPSHFSNTVPVIDLTQSDPPSPEPFQDPFQDPFPELVNAYLSDARPEPADAFNQDFMPHEELAQFLMNPTPAGGGYAFTQQQQPALHNYPFAPGFPVQEVPYLPGPVGESDSEDYGEFPLTGIEADAIEKLFENIKEHGEAPEDREPTPKLMCSTLKEYQKIGLTWLLKMENGIAKGGILADEMGLGKTVSRIHVPSRSLRTNNLSSGPSSITHLCSTLNGSTLQDNADHRARGFDEAVGKGD